MSIATLRDVHVVLVRPRWARNLGAVARTMQNFELGRLTLVDSAIGSWNDAYQMAVHSHSVLEHAERAPHLDAAVAGSRWIVGTGNQPPHGVPVLTPRQVAEQARERGAPTLVFGGEIHGLEKEELLRCHAVSTIPTGSSQSSLNLAHAVTVYAAELFHALHEAHPEAQPAHPAPCAPAEMLHHLERLLHELLHGSRWAKKSRPKHAIAELMQPFYRARMTDQEVRSWLVALGKAAQQLPRTQD